MLRATVFIALLASATSLAAVERSNDGYGQVLLYPYFNASSELSTVASVTRTVNAMDFPRDEPLGISVVVKIDTGDESGTLLSEHFTVVLAANASWNFTLSQVDGRTALVTDSTTCAFRDGEPLEGEPAMFAADGGEGWIEVYALGRSATVPGIRDLLRQRQCTDIAAQLEGLSAADWLAPAGDELRGAAHLLDIPSGTSYSLPTVALKDFSDAAPWDFGQTPTLADVSPPTTRFQSSTGEPQIATFAEHPIDAVSAALMDQQWEVDFTSEPTLGARTDLVIVAPTREWYLGEETTRAPFASESSFSPNGAVSTFGHMHDRDGNISTPPVPTLSAQSKCTPPPPASVQEGPRIGTSVVVVHFAPLPALPSARAVAMQHRSVNSLLCTYLDPVPVWERITSGRFALRFDRWPAIGIGSLISDEGHEFLGLPVIGAGLTKAVNGDVGGSLANFGLVQSISRTPGSP